MFECFVYHSAIKQTYFYRDLHVSCVDDSPLIVAYDTVAKA